MAKHRPSVPTMQRHSPPRPLSRKSSPRKSNPRNKSSPVGSGTTHDQTSSLPPSDPRALGLPVDPSAFHQAQVQWQYSQPNFPNAVHAQQSPTTYQPPNKRPRPNPGGRASRRSSKSQKAYLSYIQPPAGFQYRSPYAPPIAQPELANVEHGNQVRQQEPSGSVHQSLSFQHNDPPEYHDPGELMPQSARLRTSPTATTSTSMEYYQTNQSFSSPGLDTLLPESIVDTHVDDVIQGVLSKQMFGDDIGREVNYDSAAGFARALQAGAEEENDDNEYGAFDRSGDSEGDGEDSDFAAGSDIISRDDGEISDADSVMETYDKQVSDFRREVQKVRKEHGKKAKGKKPLQFAKPKAGGQKGPRKIAELSGDIKMRLARATGFFMVKNYHEARKEAQEIIKINAEVHQAYSMLAAIFKEWGDFDEELLAMQSCCHFLPKEEAGMSWLVLARRIDEASPEIRQKHLASGSYCCSGALKTLRNNPEALCLKGSFSKDQNHVKKAKAEFDRALKADPHNPKAMRGLAECYLDDEKPELAKKLYQEAIDFYRQSDLSENRFGWNEIAIFTELYASADEYAQALQHLKSLARWVLGRGEETYWDSVTDDREWDSDDSRRFEVPSYVPNEYDRLTYGDGLPLELRTKMGILRLKLGEVQEALVHFSFLENEAQFCGDEDLASLTELFHEVGDKLCEAGCYEDALTFYEILKRIPAEEDWSHYSHMGKCYLQVDDVYNAEQSFLTILQHDSENIAARHELAKIYDAFDHEKAAEYRQEIRSLTETAGERRRREEREERAAKTSSQQAEKPSKPPKAPKTFIARKVAKRSRRTQLMETNPNEIARQRQREEERVAGLLRCYDTLQRCKDGLEAGDRPATSEWMAAAAELVADFRTCKGLYPYDKFYYSPFFKPRSQQEQEKAWQSAAPKDKSSTYIVPSSSKRELAQRRRAEMPTSHLGLSFATWLDILVPYALCLAREQRYRDAYDVCTSAKEAVVYCHVQEAMFTIYLCWCTCATLANDMDTIVSQCRHFLKEYQFTTDAYRLFATLVRLCQSPLSHLTKGPTQKYLLRNIKTMDFSLTDHTTKEGNPEFAGMASYTARDAQGNPIINTEMDIHLLLLYGHILYVNTSFGRALHYLFRAYSLDPDNAMITMSVGLCYIQYGLKRQTQYRPYVITQGISFLSKYHAARAASAALEEREEADYNMARTYHMLGLTHLAIPYYARVLRAEAAARRGGAAGGREDLVVEAAYNLQTIYAVAGNLALAKEVTARWLVI